jgi:DNA-binding response OmpR family regulator
MGALTVLIIDSDESLRSAVFALRDAGFQVIEALESVEGVKLALDCSPIIILINEDMPPINGVELVLVLRSLTDSPIITLGSGGEMALVQALLRGADLYLTRPVNTRELLARVRSLLRRYVASRGIDGEPC